MKKIVIVQDWLRNGGTERQSLHLARAFAGAGHGVTLLTFRPGGALAPGGVQGSGFAVQSLQPFDTGLDFFAPGLARAIRRLAPDIVLCMGRMANCKAGRLARAFPGTVVISTMRTGKKLPRAYRHSLALTRHTIANSHEAARVLRDDHGVPAEKISVIHNAVVFPIMECGDKLPLSTEGLLTPPFTEEPPDDVRIGAPARQKRRQVAALQNNPLRLICSAMFRPEKNHRELIGIFARATREHAQTIELHLVGDGVELPALRTLAEKPGVSGCVHFHGFIADPAQLYREFAATGNAIAVLASRSESLPNFLVEAHAHGIPSVAYSAGGVAECGGITIAPGDQDAFLAALGKLIASPEARTAESARVAAHAREHFSPDTQLARYLELFESLTHEPAGTH